MSAPDTIAWDHAAREIDHRCAMDAAMLARALRAIGLVRERVLTRNHVPGWSPEYVRFVPWRVRYSTCGTLQARGWRAGAWSAAAEAMMDARDANDREAVAAMNRAKRDSEVYVLSRRPLADRNARRAARECVLPAYRAAVRAWFALPKPRSVPEPRLTDMMMSAMATDPDEVMYLELDSFAWRDHTGAAFGDGLASLAAFVWRMSRGRAIARLSRVVGVELIGARDLERRIAAFEAEARARVAA